VPELGIFSRTFDRPDLASVLDQVESHRFGLVHFSYASAGLGALPSDVSADQCRALRSQFVARNLRLAGASATFNTIHPDRQRRERETAAACQLIGLAPALGTSFVSISTGTRDPDDMWRGHVGNREPEAWRDLCATLGRLLVAARAAGVTLGVEPEQNNVVSSARLARRLLDEFHDEHLGIILDAANLLTLATADQQRDILAEAFDLLGPDIATVHAKDLGPVGSVAAGLGLLDYPTLFELIARHGIEAPVIIHEVQEADVDRAREFVTAQGRDAGLQWM
jgi:sugar phosphate isomerase/epimerase